MTVTAEASPVELQLVLPSFIALPLLNNGECASSLSLGKQTRSTAD
jgi:hypothetical protein